MVFQRVKSSNILTNLHEQNPSLPTVKNGLKTQKMHFLPVFELMSDSLMTPSKVLGCVGLIDAKGIDVA